MTTINANAHVRVPIQPMDLESPHSGYSDYPQEIVFREVAPAPERYRNAVGKYRIDRLASCISCGRCVAACPYGVHAKPEGYAFTLRPQDHLCIGPACEESGHYCVAQCPMVRGLRAPLLAMMVPGRGRRNRNRTVRPRCG